MKLNKDMAEEVTILLNRIKQTEWHQLSGGQQLVEMVEKDIAPDPSLPKVKTSHLEGLCRGFQAKVISNKPCGHLLSLAQSVGMQLHYEKHIAFFLMESLFVAVKRKSYSNLNLGAPTATDLNAFNNSKLQTLRYVGGYLVRQLFKKVDDDMKEALSDIIEDVRCDHGKKLLL